MNLWELGACELRNLLQTGDITSVQLIEALHKRADLTEPHIHGFARQRRKKALEEAHLCDRERAAGTTRGLLHGLPLTIKDNIDVAGLPSTVGLRTGLDNIAKKDAVVVAQARAAGAIILGKSNVPQGLLSMQCDNHIYGPASNPWSALHVTGGSSAGEGALISSGASLMGLGTDLGGSIRFPASFCGVVGFKPSQDLWSNQGICTAIAGQEFVRAQVGPMARRCEDIALLYRALPALSQSKHDPRVPPLPGAPLPKVKGMRIGYYSDDGFLTPTPAMRRAVAESVEYLRNAGAQVVPFTPLHQQELVALYLGATSSDGLATLRTQFASEPLTPSIRLMWLLGTLSSPVRRAGSALLGKAGEQQLAMALRVAGRKSVASLWRLTAQRNTLIDRVAAAWKSENLDALLCPASATPAVPKGMEHDASLIFSYFGRYNILGMPAGVVPVTRVLPGETAMSSGYERTSQRVAAIAKHSLHLPVAVQVVAPRWRDQNALAVMAALETHARRSPHFPHTPVFRKAHNR